ncbi:MAG: helix-turn-helix domain-containing protein [Acidithiobacillus sp.]
MKKETLGRATVTVDEAARILGVGRASAYEGVRQGLIPSIRVSPRRIVIARAVIERLLSGEPLRP